MSASDPFISIFHEWMEIFMHRSMRGYIHYARERGLSRSMIGTLHHLSYCDHVGVSDVGEHLGVSSAAASQMLENLVEEGLIQRSEDPDDRRMKKLALTDKGTRVMKGSVSARLGWLDDLKERLTDEEISQITSALKLIIIKANEMNFPAKGSC